MHIILLQINKGLSDAAQVKVVSQSDSHMDIEIVDPAKTDNINAPKATSEDTSDNSLQASSNPRPKETQEGEKSSAEEDSAPEKSTSQSPEASSIDSHQENSTPHEVESSTSDIEQPKNGSDEKASGSFVKVEADGSIFVRADTDYVESRTQGKVAYEGERTKDRKIKFSNKLMFSLD